MTRCERSMVAPDACDCRLERDVVEARWAMTLDDAEVPSWLHADSFDSVALAVHDA